MAAAPLHCVCHAMQTAPLRQVSKRHLFPRTTIHATSINTSLQPAASVSLSNDWIVTCLISEVAIERRK